MNPSARPEILHKLFLEWKQDSRKLPASSCCKLQTADRVSAPLFDDLLTEATFRCLSQSIITDRIIKYIRTIRMSTEESPRRSRRSSRPSTGQTVTSVLSAEYLNKHSSKVSDSGGIRIRIRISSSDILVLVALTHCTALVLDIAIPFYSP